QQSVELTGVVGVVVVDIRAVVLALELHPAARAGEAVEGPGGHVTGNTGVSGSGKSSLVNEILFKRLGVELNRMKVHPGKCDRIEGIEYLDKVVDIDPVALAGVDLHPVQLHSQ